MENESASASAYRQQQMDRLRRRAVSIEVDQDDPDIVHITGGLRPGERIVVLHRQGESREDYIARSMAALPPLGPSQSRAIRAEFVEYWDDVHSGRADRP